MLLKLSIVCGLVVVSIVIGGTVFMPVSESTEELESIRVDVVMPTKVSRPGCEITDECYVPSSLAVQSGDSVTWINDDSAFHSVTSGTYDTPLELFDSGYMDPFETFSYTFDDPGTYEYYCTLHPWMEGEIIVRER